tara:strand:+ start:2413 stop:2802 length:390 start_codon:yes stop_codon:yes gene_type:complete
MSILKQDQDIFIRFFNLLDDKQRRIYSNIMKERLMIYMTAMFSGLVAGLIYYYKNPKQKYPVCTFLAIVYLTKLGVYYFYPKSPLMLYSLTTKEQTDAWAQIYEEMKYRYKISLLVGFIGYLILFNGLK